MTHHKLFIRSAKDSNVNFSIAILTYAMLINFSVAKKACKSTVYASFSAPNEPS